jgi:uncharacterized protein (DUF697 family)
MSTPLKVANVWRVIRDVDLDGIRATATGRFELWIVAADPLDAAAVADLLSPGAPHPWVRALEPPAAPQPPDPPPIAAVLVTRTADLPPALSAVRNALRAARGRTVTLVLGAAGPAAAAPHVGEDARVAAAALDAGALDPLATALLSVVAPDERVALGRQLTALRPAVFTALIRETAQANASFALTTGLAETVPVLTAPLNLGDIVILTKNQLLLGYRIVLTAGRDGEPRALIGEIVGVLGSGVIFRQMARQLVGLIPVAGIVPKVAIAYSGTHAIGRALVLWVTEGRQVTAAGVQRMTSEGLGRGRQFAEQLLADARARGTAVGGRWQRLRSALPGLRRRGG